MSRPSPLSGFPELLPAERNAEQAVIDGLRRTFELHGFASVETRAVEPLDRLAKGGEIDKEVYVLRRLRAEEGEDSGLGMHFDLTVPFARYVLEHAGKLEFPFRRYQIQRVWRGERPQEGRFREFTQADIDIVARDALPFHADVEVAAVMAEALSALPVPTLRMQVSNRRLLEGFYRGLGLADPDAVMRTVDKLDKVPAEQVADLLQSDAGASAEQAQACLRLAQIQAPDASFVKQVRELGVSHELLDQGLDELSQVMDVLAGTPLDGVTVTADLRIARGLDYYTGTVFETRMDGFERLGSVCSGGRYDALASDGKTTYPGVGISLGITRMLVPLVQRGMLTSSRSVPSAVLVALVDEASRPQSIALAQRLRARGIPAEVAAAAQKFGKQIRYAERRGIPYVWFPAPKSRSELASPAGGGSQAQPDQVKDIRSGNQADADADTWMPPRADLRPTIVTPETDTEEQAP